MSASAFGLYRHSLADGSISAVVLFGMFTRAETQRTLAYVFSLAWGVVAGGSVYAIDPTEPVAWIAAGIIGAALSLGAHMAAFQWQNDYQ